jgi:cysteine desulfurase/selenocysteine lyase
MRDVDMQTVREQFPALAAKPHGQRLAFLDSAASAQKPDCVINALTQALSGPYANIHRGLYWNSATTTAAFEESREVLARFIGAHPAEIVWTRNSTESLNLIAQTWGRQNLRKGDVIVLTELEHHANIVPWQLLQAEKGFEIRVLPVNADGSLNLDTLPDLLRGAKLLTITQMSNVTGYKPPLEILIPAAKAAGAVVVVDGSQGAVHAPQNMATLGADFYVLTGHKLYGPNGVGALWARAELLAAMPPYQGGGDMIDEVHLPTGTTFAAPPARFEAGTPAIAEVIAFAEALKFMESIGWQTIQSHEHTLATALSDMLEGLPFIQCHSPRGTGIASLTMQGCHSADVAMILDEQGVAVRSGHHCAMPLLRRQNLLQTGTFRASLGLYTCMEDITQLEGALKKAKAMLG